MQSYDYTDRLLEIHSAAMWNMSHVDMAIQFAHKYRLTGLIFHCNDLLDRLVLPAKYFDKDLSLARWPVRDATLINNHYYINDVLARCREAGLEFYAEVKELYYPAEIVELFPFLRKENGAICPTEAFWWEFLEEKVREFVATFPSVAGIIVSPGTRESMVSLAANGCVCDRCRTYDIDVWYRQLIQAMYRPLAEKGKRLIVRDFAYTRDHQHAMVDAAGDVSDDIIMALKKTPHDYYPTFPDNPAVGQCGHLRQWIEYDTWGQYFGLGVLPCSVVEDMQGRMQRYLTRGASGVMLRTDWEIISEGSVFRSFNLLNLIAGAMLSADVDTPTEDIYRAWLNEGLYTPLRHHTFPQNPCVPRGEKALTQLSEYMKRSWKVLEKTIYVRGHVFQENAQPFDRVDMGYNMMVRFHGQDEWDPEASRLVEPTDENIALIFREKEEGVALAESLSTLVEVDKLGVSEEIARYFEFLNHFYVLYTCIMRDQAHTVFLIEKARRTLRRVDIDAALATLEPFTSHAEALKSGIQGKGFANVVEWCLDGERVFRFKADAERILRNLGG
jgi:hypothetical protein